MISTSDLQYCLPGLSLSFEIVANVEDLVTNPEDDDQIPYWAELWPASRGLAQYIWEHVDFSGDKVLELGAGLGLPGLVAGRKGARVTISDYQPDALKIASRNALRNGIGGVAFELADWRDWHLRERFDWIIGSDVLYNPRSNPYVGRILANNLAASGQLLFAHPGRQVTLSFLGELVASGFKERRGMIPVTVDNPLLSDYKIDIHHLQKVMSNE
ncbi:MAG: methyltransferase domain-containing protein [Thermacetogeniaceae bacterium]|jgi:predicted nicotinamide N-methyase